MTRLRIAIISSLLLLSIACSESSPSGARQESVRGVRYCEVLAVVSATVIQDELQNTYQLATEN